MRIVAVLVMSLGMLAPVAGQEQNLFQQYEAATAIFSKGYGDPSHVMRDWPATLLDGLDGEWFPIDAAIPAGNDVALFRMICEQASHRIAVRGSLAFEMTRFLKSDSPVTTIYSSRGGNAFGAQTDPEALVNMLGADARPGTVGNMLATYNGTATLHRPGPDLLVIQTDYNAPALFGRCPE